MTLAAKLDVVPAIFTAPHTFGRDLKLNVHVHLFHNSYLLTS